MRGKLYFPHEKQTKKLTGETIVQSLYSVYQSRTENLWSMAASLRYTFKVNYLVSDGQLAYRAGHSTDLLPMHLTETWRRALDSRKAVAVALVDYRKAFDSVFHDKQETARRQQFTVLNGVRSDVLRVSFGIYSREHAGADTFYSI